MRAFYHILLFGALILGAAACSSELEIPVEEPNTTPTTPTTPSGPVTLTASIANETGTKATLSESDENGIFAFSSTDAIKVFNGTGLYASTCVSINGTTATFTMEDGFLNTGSGLAAFPAGIVNNISEGGVTFTLPASYTYDQVGGSDPSAALVPCPMIASYNHGTMLSFKQAGAVVRFRIANCLAGDLTFTFTTKVTGAVTLATVPSSTGDGILASNLSNGGYSITVTGVPAASGENYFYITLPVPTGTDPMNVGVWNKGATANNVATLSGTVVLLNRANGYRRGVSLVDVKDAAKFNNLFLAGYLYNYNDTSYGIIDDPLEILTYYHSSFEHNQYYFCWNDIIRTIPKLFESEGYRIGESYYYRAPSGGTGGEWAGIVGTSRNAANVKSMTAHYALVKINGLSESTYHTKSVWGLLLFPDNAIIAVPSDTNFSSLDAMSSITSLSISTLTYLLNQGCAFLPAAGYSEWKNNQNNWGDINISGYFWSRTNYDSTDAYALAFSYNSSSLVYSINPDSGVDVKETAYFPIRLIRVN